MKIKTGNFLIFFTKILILAALLAVFAVGQRYFYVNPDAERFYFRGYVLILFIYAVGLYITSKVYNGFNYGNAGRQELVFSWMMCLLLANGMLYLILSLIYDALLPVHGIIIITVIQTFIIVPMTLLADKIYFLSHPSHKAIIIYGKRDKLHEYGEKISHHRNKFRIMRTISQDDKTGLLLDSIDEAESVFFLDIDSTKQEWLLEYCYLHNKYIYILPTFSDILLNTANTLWLANIPAFSLKSPKPDVSMQLVKRVIDIAVSLLAIILTSPLMLLISLAIFLYDREAILYKQTRVTVGSKNFTLLKFRSMTIDAESDGVPRLTAKEDDRVTPIGRFLRKTRLDELPQLFNVLAGRMSLVGPRPERPEIAKQYEEQYPNFAFRTKVKAGITGYAQIYGQYNTAPDEKLLLDIMYIESFSILLDFKLLLQTVRVLFMKKSTEGIDDGSITALKQEKKKG